MKLIRGLHNLPLLPSGSAVTIGNFDGVHQGHSRILDALCLEAQQRQLSAVVIIFEPQPLEYFQPEYAPVRLTPLRDKLALLQKHPIDYVICLSFNRQLAHLQAQDFINTLLLKRLNTRYLLVGDDFQFGYRREGNLTLLKQAAIMHGFSVAAAPTVMHESSRISSTLIRQTLQQGNLELGSLLLGHAYRLLGRVIHGYKRGRSIGFPTANIRLPKVPIALQGVYIVEVLDHQSTCYYGVANIGIRPTLNGTQRLLEVHLFEFNKDIYGQQLQVTFRCKLRDEQRFPHIEALQQQIQRDVIAAKQFFGIEA